MSGDADPSPYGDQRAAETHSTRTSASIKFWPLVPATEAIEERDFEKLPVYARLLLLDSHGALNTDMARAVFLGTETHNLRIALIAVDSHLARARWLFERKFEPLMWAMDD